MPARDSATPKRVKRESKRHKGRVLKLIVTTPGEITIREGTADGRIADLIDAPEGTRIERPKEADRDKALTPTGTVS